MDAGIFNVFNRNRELSEAPKRSRQNFKDMQATPLLKPKTLAEDNVLTQIVSPLPLTKLDNSPNPEITGVSSDS